MSFLEKLPVFITQGNQFALKCRLNCARRGQNLLGRKSDGLRSKFHNVFDRLLKSKSDVESTLREARISLAEVKYAVGNVNELVLQSVERASIKVTRKQESVGGIKIESFAYLQEDFDDFEYAGLSGGRQQIQNLKSNYRKSIGCLIELASLRQTFLTLSEAISVLTRRVNALRHSIIPRLELTLAYLSSELDEYEREEFYRLKKLQRKRKTRSLRKDDGGKDVRCDRIKNLLDDADDQDLLF